MLIANRFIALFSFPWPPMARFFFCCLPHISSDASGFGDSTRTDLMLNKQMLVNDCCVLGARAHSQTRTIVPFAMPLAEMSGDFYLFTTVLCVWYLGPALVFSACQKCVICHTVGVSISNTAEHINSQQKHFHYQFFVCITFSSAHPNIPVSILSLESV